MNKEDIKAIYFIGAGGIGMSAIARFFIRQGIVVAGYDKTPSALTEQLTKEGMLIHYEDNTALIPEACKDKERCLVVYTPAIPEDHSELHYFHRNGFEIQKRAQLLGTLTRSMKGLCVAGTHGKTTTSAMCAHIMHQSHVDCNAFLGGISKNYHTNYILSKDKQCVCGNEPSTDGNKQRIDGSKQCIDGSKQRIDGSKQRIDESKQRICDDNKDEYVVIEADEFDRSFHWLHPWMSVITSSDPDHLDIYGTKEAYLDSFRHYTTLIQPGGALIIHKGLEMRDELQEGVRRYEYSRDAGDFHAANIRIEDGEITFDLISPLENVYDVELGQPIPINIENGVAAMAMAQLCGCTAAELREGMRTYAGVDRRFDFKIKTRDLVFLSDYAHHPKEIYQSAKSLREMYGNKKITAMFQPHLYTRTRDFYKDFASALSILDRVVLLDIYPARELPIDGVTSKLIYDNLADGVEKAMIKKADVPGYIRDNDFEVLAVLGAGDLDNMTGEMTEILERKLKGNGKETEKTT